MKLQQFMQESGKSVREIASDIGVTEMAVRHWVSGNRVPRRDVMSRISTATGGAVQPADFFDTESDGRAA